MPETTELEISEFRESSQLTRDPCHMKSKSHPIQYGDGMLINSESAVTPNFNKEQYVPRLNPAVLAATPQSASSVENEELQAPTMSGMEESWTKDTHVDNTPDNPPSSQSETMVSSPATPPCRRYPLRLRKPPERLNL